MFKKIKASVKNFVQKVKTAVANHFRKNTTVYATHAVWIVATVVCGIIGLKLGRKHPVDVSSATEYVSFKIGF